MAEAFRDLKLWGLRGWVGSGGGDWGNGIPGKTQNVSGGSKDGR